MIIQFKSYIFFFFHFIEKDLKVLLLDSCDEIFMNGKVMS